MEKKYKKLNRKSISSIGKFNDLKTEIKTIFKDVENYDLIENWLEYKINYQKFILKIMHTVYSAGVVVAVLNLLMDGGLFPGKISHLDLILIGVSAIVIVIAIFIEIKSYYKLTFYIECASILQELDNKSCSTE